MNHEYVFRGAARALAFAIGLGIVTTTPPAGAYQRIEWGELALEEERGDRAIGMSFFARWAA